MVAGVDGGRYKAVMAREQPLPVRVAVLSMVVCRRQLAAYSHIKSPRKFTQRQLMTCLVLKALHDETYRGVLTLLEMAPALRAAVGLEEAQGKGLPHFTTLQKFFERVAAADPGLIDRLVGEVLAECQAAGLAVTEVAGDSTGIECSVASRHFAARAGRGRGRYIKLAVLLACGSLLPVSVHAAVGPDNELNGAWDLVWRATGRCTPQVAYYDAGFDAEAFHVLHRAGWGVAGRGRGVISIIPPVPKTRDGSIKTPHRAACRRLPARYGRRWHVESFFSGLKRVCGEAVRSRKQANQLAEAMLKVLAYALRR